MGHFQTSADATAMSAFPLIATKLRTSRHVRFVPTADKRKGGATTSAKFSLLVEVCSDLTPGL